MPTKIVDMQCPQCEKYFEHLYHGSGDILVPDCPFCKYELPTETISGGTVTKLHDPEVLKETLKKRSSDHTLHEMKKIAGHKGTLPADFGRPGGPTIR